MTSNIGSLEISEYAGKDEEKMKSKVMEVLRYHFKPEFLNRLDDIIIFHALDRDQIKQIVDIQIQRLNKRLAERKLIWSWTILPDKCWRMRDSIRHSAPGP